MDAHLLLFTQSALRALYIIMYSKGNFLDSFLDFVHTDVAVEVAEYLLQRALFWHIATNVVVFYHYCRRAATNERGEDILCSLDGYMCIAKCVILDFNLILEEAQQLMVCLLRESSNTIFGTQFHLTDVAQLLIAWCGQTEGVLETILCCRVCRQEVVQALGQTSHNNDGVFVPFVHLDKQLIQWIHLIRVAIRQQLLDIIEEEDAAFGITHILVPFFHEALVVDGIDHRQLGFRYDFILMEIVSNHLCQSGLTCTRLTNDNGVHAQTDIHHVPARMEIGIGIDNGFQLLLHVAETYQTVQNILRHQWVSTILTELGYRAVFLLTMLTNHIYSTSFCNCSMTLFGERLILSFSGIL